MGLKGPASMEGFGMIGKVHDIVSAAVVIGAADRAGSGEGAAIKPEGVQGTESSSAAKNKGLNSITALEKSMQKDNKEKQDDEFQMDEESVSNMTNELNELMNKINCDLEFKWNKEVDLMTVTMVDKKTKETIKQFPPEDMIKNMINAKEWIGAFLDKNA